LHPKREEKSLLDMTTRRLDKEGSRLAAAPLLRR